MTNFLKFTWILAVALLFSCNEDDNDADANMQMLETSEFMFDDWEAYDTPYSYYLSFDAGEETEDKFIIELINSSLEIEDWDGACDYSKDVTHGVIIYLKSFEKGNIAPGTYSFDDTLNVPCFTTGTAFFYDQFSTTDCYPSSEIEMNFISGGKLKIEKKGNQYTLDYEFIFSDNGLLQGNYTGEILSPIQ